MNTYLAWAIALIAVIGYWWGLFFWLFWRYDPTNG